MDMVATLEDFFRHLARAPEACLMLDYDGTLAPFNADPAQARPYPGVLAILDRIQSQTSTRLVMVSGRWSRDLLPLLQLGRRPEVWGSHGWERLAADGAYRAEPVAPESLRSLVEVDEWSAQIEALGGRCEFKPAGVAIHWRGLPPGRVDAIRSVVLERWSIPPFTDLLELHEFDGGLELRAPGRTKGSAVEAVLAELPATAAVAFLGDDVTDEDAFKAVNHCGLSVLVRAEYRATAARAWLRPPGELLDFLWRWHAARGGTP